MDARVFAEELKNRLPGNASFSQYYTASICLRKYWAAYVVGHREPPSPRMIRGTAVHAALATMHKQVRDKQGPPSHDDAMQSFVDAAGPEWVESTIEGVPEVLGKYWKDEGSSYWPLEVEAHVSVLLRPLCTRVRGYVDLFADRLGGHTKLTNAIVDFKVPMQDPRTDAAQKSLQLALYSTASGNDRAELVHLLIRKKGPRIIRQPTIITPERRQKAARWLHDMERVVRQAHKTNFWPRRTPDHICDRCYLKNACWGGERVAKVENWKEKFGDPDRIDV